MDDKASFVAAKKSKKTGFGNILISIPNALKRSKLKGNGAGRAEAVTSTSSSTLNRGIIVLVSTFLADLADFAHHPDPTATSRPATISSVPDLPRSTLGQDHGCKTDLTSISTSEPLSTNSHTKVPNWKATAIDDLGVAARFGLTLLKRLPDCTSGNPVSMALSILRVIVEMKDMIGDNNDELAQRLKETEHRLVAMERSVAIGVPKAAEQEMAKLKQILLEEMEKLEDLARKSLAKRILDHEEYQKILQQVSRRINGATTTFQIEMANSIQETANMIQAALEHLRPSEKADHKTILEEQGLKCEECTPGTRLTVLENITNWANDRSSASPHVYWLTGQAGSGKTTVAYTIAKRFEENGNANQHTVLGGNLLCSRQFQETQLQTRIIPTIVYQLARKCKSYANALHVADKFDAANHDICVQMKDLLVGPWLQSEATRDSGLSPYLIVIDALDEIIGDGGPRFLRYLLNAVDEFNLQGLKFLVTSRSNPELVKLCETFTSDAICRLQHVPIKEAKSDIETYLEAKLPMIAGSPELVELLRRAGGLFIYAAMAVRYLTLSESFTAKEQTELLNELFSKTYESASASDATSLIDELYRQIIGMHICLRCCRTPVKDNDDAARAVLHSLHPVLYTQDNQVFWYHASFPDFIFDQTRSNFNIRGEKFEFWCKESDHHNLLVEACFRVMKSGLRFNMGNIKSSFLFDCDNAVALSEQVNKNIKPVLKYSSSHWVHHLPLPDLVDTENLCDYILDFLQICSALPYFKCQNSNLELARNIGEAANFATYFAGSPAAKSTPHLYISILATLPHDTALSPKWRKQFPRIPVFTHTAGMVVLPLMTILAAELVTAVAVSNNGSQIVSGLFDGTMQVWDASTGTEVRALKGHLSRVKMLAFSSNDSQILSGSHLDETVRVWDVATGSEVKVLELVGQTNSYAFSSDGMLIVSGSYENLVRVWDASTGAEMKVLKGHTGPVSSVAFSSNGMRIVSGSYDKSVRVWDTLSGAKVKVLEGHTGHIHSVAFSSDGRKIVSGSEDGYLQVWDALTEVTVLKGHTDRVNSVMFSSDGRQIVSGSRDKSIRVWDGSTGAELKVLKGHTDEVSSVAFYNNGMKIVSSSMDETVRVWDTSTSVKVKALQGHPYLVRSVVFSGDGTQIVSGYDSVRLWDASTGAELKVLEGHTCWVNSVAFTSDGKQIASFDHKSMRLWDAATGAELMVLRGHTSWVTSVAFSSDDMQIVSGSSDQSVRVWDTSTGVEVKMMKGHTREVRSIAFSRDGTQIVSGAEDKTVRVWNALTGAEVKVLKGHTDAVNSVAFSSDGTKIVSCSEDQSIRVWSLSAEADSAWILTETNWIVSSQGGNHLMWVPPSAEVPSPSNILIISCHGFGSVEFTQSMIASPVQLLEVQEGLREIMTDVRIIWRLDKEGNGVCREGTRLMADGPQTKPNELRQFCRNAGQADHLPYQSPEITPDGECPRSLFRQGYFMEGSVITSDFKKKGLEVFGNLSIQQRQPPASKDTQTYWKRFVRANDLT
ncbi:hypothetical protein B0H34DRAFT_800488 [Crassisporium funariophilum]|nr:hypothetical protein B0H34DRAFT_800488 [Crassisporium funariophilum]